MEWRSRSRLSWRKKAMMRGTADEVTSHANPSGEPGCCSRSNLKSVGALAHVPKVVASRPSNHPTRATKSIPPIADLPASLAELRLLTILLPHSLLSDWKNNRLNLIVADYIYISNTKHNNNNGIQHESSQRARRRRRQGQQRRRTPITYTYTNRDVSLLPPTRLRSPAHDRRRRRGSTTVRRGGLYLPAETAAGSAVCQVERGWGHDHDPFSVRHVVAL